jgi:hypothetical protein
MSAECPAFDGSDVSAGDALGNGGSSLIDPGRRLPETA